MLYKMIASALLAGMLVTCTVEAYDLPKIKADKKITAKKGEIEKKPILKSDWKETERFEARLKSLLAENKKLPAASPERVSYDKNRVFIAFYKGNAYFLDKYSVEVKRDEFGEQSWTQKIFPIGKNVSPKNSVSTDQRFFFDGRNCYNSLKVDNPISGVENAEDKDFLQECFKVGYYFAFGEELCYEKR